MKIEANDDVRRVTQRPAQKDAQQKGGAFAALFNEALTTTTHRSEKSGPSTPLGTGVMPLGLNPLSQDGGRSVVAQAERLVDLLAGYQEKLENPAVTLREIEPMMGQMDAISRELVPKADALPANHPLKGVLAETLITVSLELQRFHGGLYNP
jgi:hypothetical protein